MAVVDPKLEENNHVHGKGPKAPCKPGTVDQEVFPRKVQGDDGNNKGQVSEACKEEKQKRDAYDGFALVVEDNLWDA